MNTHFGRKFRSKRIIYDDHTVMYDYYIQYNASPKNKYIQRKLDGIKLMHVPKLRKLATSLGIQTRSFRNGKRRYKLKHSLIKEITEYCS